MTYDLHDLSARTRHHRVVLVERHFVSRTRPLRAVAALAQALGRFSPVRQRGARMVVAALPNTSARRSRRCCV